MASIEPAPRARPQLMNDTVRNRLIESRLTPNAISLTGLVLCLAAAVLAWQEQWIAAGIAFIVGSVCDTLDGRYSRMSGKGTPFGAFLDSTLDRIEEGLMLAAIGVYYASRADELAVFGVIVAAVASLMVSYTRARAEALGVECKVGFGNRAARVAILSTGILLFGVGVDALDISVYVLAVLGTITFLQRIFHVRGKLNQPLADRVVAPADEGGAA